MVLHALSIKRFGNQKNEILRPWLSAIIKLTFALYRSMSISKTLQKKDFGK